MSSFLGALALVAGFVALLRLTGVIPRAGRAAEVARTSMDCVRSRELDDDAKEKLMQANAKELFGLFLQLTVLGALCLLVPVGGLWVLDQLGALSLAATLELTLSWEFLLGSTVLGTLLWWALSRLGRGNKAPGGGKASTDAYSATDRALHHLAFRTTTAQLALDDMERSMFKKELQAADPARPVFIAGLPRGGTTLLLNMCCVLEEFASHRYRDMPFVLVPMLWARFSKSFQKPDRVRERAHGDGMMVSEDSPEALEEMLWKCFWKKQYEPGRILPWPGIAPETAPDADPETAPETATNADPAPESSPDAAPRLSAAGEEFREYFAAHQRKVIALRMQATGKPARYLSKNNLNIARIPYLVRAFPDARVVVPFRTPLQHAASLLRQHRNFLAVHGADPFAKAYMEGLGHYDFGENLRPVDFDGWLEGPHEADPLRLGFWLDYWTAAYARLLAEAGGRVFLHDHDALCARPGQALPRIAEALDIADRETFLRNEATIRRPRPHEVRLDEVNPETLRRAEELHERLRAAALEAE